MCFIVAVVMSIFALNAFLAQEYLLGSSSLLIAIFFITLMVRNILYVKKLKEEKRENLVEDEK